MLGPEVLGGIVGTPANEGEEADTGTHVCNVSCMQTGSPCCHCGTDSIPWRVTCGSLFDSDMRILRKDWIPSWDALTP